MEVGYGWLLRDSWSRWAPTSRDDIPALSSRSTRGFSAGCSRDGRRAARKTERRKPSLFYTLLPEVEVEVVEEPEHFEKRKRKEREQQAQRAKQIAAQRAEEPRYQHAGPCSNPKPAEPLKTKAVEHSVEPEPGVKAYMLQVGSFRELADADRLRAKLTLGRHQALINPWQVGPSFGIVFG